MTAEHRRRAEARNRGTQWKCWGVPQRACLGHCRWRLQRSWNGPGAFRCLRRICEGRLRRHFDQYHCREPGTEAVDVHLLASRTAVRRAGSTTMSCMAPAMLWTELIAGPRLVHIPSSASGRAAGPMHESNPPVGERWATFAGDHRPRTRSLALPRVDYTAKWPVNTVTFFGHLLIWPGRRGRMQFVPR